MFMAERLSYYERIQHALDHPDEIMSMISDGMSQNHCALPWLSGQKEFDAPIKQKIQGVLEHGVIFTIYRSFHNVGGGANLAIYAFLSQLESFYKRNKRYPRIIYHQIDGGNENANKYLLSVFELVISAGIGVEKIVYTRLPVGHTHEGAHSSLYISVVVHILNLTIIFV
jgi:hypothetical protein